MADPQMTSASTPGQGAGSLADAGQGFSGKGMLLVTGAGLCWSFGGAIARYLDGAEDWTVVFWRSTFAALFLLGFMLWRDGPRGTLALFRTLGPAGYGVALCFASASTAFIVALAHTSVANILLMQAGAPLIAALLGWLLFRERVPGPTWAAIAAVAVGIAIMVSDSFAARVSVIGDGLALLITVAFAVAVVLTRKNAHVRMTPAVFLAMAAAACVTATLSSGLAVGPRDLGLLFLFGALNLGLGMAFFVTGTRMIPAALTALITMLEPVLGPVWVWLMHDELPNGRTMIGGGVVFLALLVHLLLEWRRQGRPGRGAGRLPPAV